MLNLHRSLTRALPLAGTRRLSDGPTTAELTLEASFAEALIPALESFYRYPLRNGIDEIPEGTEAQVQEWLSTELATDAATAVLVFVIFQNMQQGVNVGGQLALAELGLPGRFYLANQQIIGQIRRFVGRLVSRRGSLSLVQTTSNELARRITAGRAAGLTNAQINADMGNYLAQRVVTRSAGIATTEAVRATRSGLTMGYGRNGITFMIHRTVEGACPICGPLNGERYPIASGFVVGAIPLHPNCRCWYEPDTAVWTVPASVWTGE
jgi:hypothetical protein